MRKSIAFIGVGNMGGAILDGILKSGIFPAQDIILCDTQKDKCMAHSALCRYTAQPCEAVAAAETVILAIKPQQMDALLTEIAPLCAGKLMISIAAGVTVERIQNALPGASVVRVMPNTPLQVGEGVSVLCRAENVSDEDFQLASRIFAASGTVSCMDESALNAVTALTSSSIAYFARFIGDMCAWAKEHGFTDDAQTLDLVCHAAIGSAQLLLQTEHTPASLERAVTSPNGTTERAMAVFSEQNLHEIVSAAMSACLRRADELSAN